MDLSQPEESPNIFQKSWETIVAFHYYIAPIIIIASGVEFFYKGGDKEGIMALALLLIAVLFEMSVIVSNNRKHTHHLTQITKKFDETSEELAILKKESAQILSDLNAKITYLGKKNKNLALIGYLNAAFNDIRSGEREDGKNGGDEHKFIAAFNAFCNTLNTAFNEVTGKDFHVCIKIIVDPGNLDEVQNLNKLKKYRVRTFIREGNLLSTRTSHDRSTTAVLIKDNTDFNQIVDTWNTKQKPFFSNNLIALKDYSNSRFIDLYGSPKNLYDKAPIDEKEANWKLHYKSCITAAIGFTGRNKKNVPVGTIIGFLCIDSIEKDVFDEEIHPLIVQGCAEGLFNSLYKFLTTYKSDKYANIKSSPQPH